MDISNGVFYFRKMKRLQYIIFFLVFSVSLNTIGQDTIWPKIFSGYSIYDIQNTYDNGFALAGWKTTEVDPYYLGYGILKKLDVNGNLLWEKYIGMNPPPAVTNLHYVNQTNDGGYILSGVFSGSDWDGGDVFIMKLNACGELEWNTYIESEGPQINNSVYELEDGSFITLIGQWGINDDPTKRVWLFKLSENGEVLWQKLYANWNPEINNNETTSDFVKSDDGNFIITGTYNGYYETYSQQPMFIKVDTAGNEIWHYVINGTSDSLHVGQPMFGDTDSQGNIYSGGNHKNAGYLRAPIVYKVNSYGQSYIMKDIFTISDSLLMGFAHDTKCLNDTTIFVFAGWKTTTDSLYTYVYELDSSLNIIHRKILSDSLVYYWPMGTVITNDNKYVAVGFRSIYPDEDIWASSFWKLQSNLEYDTLYTQQFTYDSLCPYPITNDTIPLDTTVVINLEHLWNILKPMSIFPNPVRDKLNIRINIVRWQEREIRINDINGSEVMYEKLPPGIAKYNLNLSGLKNGIYIISLYEKGKLLQTEKFVVAKE